MKPVVSTSRNSSFAARSKLLPAYCSQEFYYVRHFGPSYVYIKYRCSRCKKLGEHFIKQEDWEQGILKDASNEVNTTEKTRFETMGKITIDEMIDFHYQLEKLDKLPEEMPTE